MLRHSRKIALVAAAAILAGCATPGVGPPSSDRQIEEAIIGTWITNDDPALFTRKTYFRGGTARGTMTESGPGEGTKKWTFESRWKIENGVMIVYDIRSNPPGMLWKGAIAKDRIISIDKKRYVFEDTIYGGRFERIRER
jgi:hypothetical protein